MDDTTLVEMVHVSGKEAETHQMQIGAGERLIAGCTHVKRLYVLKEGTVMVAPAPGAKLSLTRTEYVGLGNDWCILGARPFFTARPSRLVYTALTDCTIFWFDSRMFQTAHDEKGLSRESLLGIARGLVLNSDISEIFVPKIAKVLGCDIPESPTEREMQAGVELITAPCHVKRFQSLAFTSLVKLLRKHELVMNGKAHIVGSRALAEDRRRTATPPPPPCSLARRVWEASHK